MVSLISKAHSENIQVYADIVLNHNSGGQLENNPYTGTQTYTDFTGVASGKFQEQAPIFIKHAYANNDEGVFEVSDLAHVALMFRIGFGYDLMA
jgi:alpha-amylase